MNWYPVSAFGSIVANLLIAFFVYMRSGRTRAVNVYFSLMALCIALWSIQDILQTTYTPGDPQVVLWLTRACHLAACFIPVFWLHFFFGLLELDRRKLLFVLYSLSLSLAALDISTPLFIRELATSRMLGYTRLVPVGGPLYYVYMTFFAVAGLYGFYELGRGYGRFRGIKRNQIKWLFMAAIVAFSGGLLYFLTALLKVELPPMDNVIVAVYVSIIAYAIVKHQLMDINIIIRKGLAYGISTGLVTSTFIVSVLGFERLFRHYAGYTALPVAAIAALIIALTFYPVKNRIQKVVDKYFYRGAYDYHGMLSNASRAMTSILDLDKLLSYMVAAVVESMKIEQAWIVLRSVKARRFEVRLTAGFKEGSRFPDEPALGPRNPLIERLRNGGETIVREEMERMLPPIEVEPLSNEMKKYNADVAIPIMLKERLMGAILLGPKLSGGIYSREDLQLLSTLANQSAIAIRNAQLYSRLQRDLDTIRSLEREKARAERLASLGTMAAGIAHEIKNPLVSIKTLAQLLPEKSSDPEFRDVFSQIAVKEIERIDSLVIGLLSLSKPPPPRLEPVDVNSVLEETLSPIGIRLEERRIKLKKEYQADLPQVMGDSLQLKQVFSNILINGIQATPEGGRISVATSLERDSGDKNGHVEIKISDSGAGIPDEDVDKIFNPFFTTKHEGVGLGLTICHRIIEDHRGDIRVNSKKGAGTTFVISLPAVAAE